MLAVPGSGRRFGSEPCPRRNSGSTDNSTGERTGPCVHSIASITSNSASPRRAKQPRRSSRNRRNTPTPSARGASWTPGTSSCKLAITTFGLIMSFWRRTRSSEGRPMSRRHAAATTADAVPTRAGARQVPHAAGQPASGTDPPDQNTAPGRLNLKLTTQTTKPYGTAVPRSTEVDRADGLRCDGVAADRPAR
jgi:hypothetical protein